MLRTLIAVLALAAPLSIEQVNKAEFKTVPATGAKVSPVVLKAQVLLDRQFYSPGEIDGRMGENIKKALRVFQVKNGLRGTGKLDAKAWKALVGDGSAAVLTHYAITEQDVKGPFTPRIPKDVKKAAHLKRLDYTSPVELIGEKFHMSPKLLKQLNPGADFKSAGTKLVVANVAGRKPEGKVAEVVVDKTTQSVRSYDKDGNLIAFYPATVGSGDFPSPSGNLKVTAVAEHPPLVLTSRLEYADVPEGKVIKVPSGPNNPVGAVWIALNKHGYGIHGTAEPSKISKSESHGCVRLTNWDAKELATMVHAGTPVHFK